MAFKLPQAAAQRNRFPLAFPQAARRRRA